jgi:peptidyl-prolyl cis-trans isomerase A (cyclophilin A)
MKKLLIAILACGIAVAQTKTGADKKTDAAKKAPAAPNLLNPSSMRARAPETYKAKFTTTKGDVIIQVHRGWAPLGADRFYNLVRGGFYKDAAFFRVLPRFMAQFGISARPDVADAWENAKILDDKVIESNKRGTVTFATAGPNTRTTQIFINYGDNAQLDGQGFAPFGQVIEGMDVVDKFYSGYGEGAPSGRGPDQGEIRSKGKAYLDRFFPQLDRIINASIVTDEAAPAAGDTKK